MSDPFAPPPGDAAALKAAAKTFHDAATALDANAGQAKTAVATALAQWHAPRTQQFRDAGAGMQAQLVMVITALGRAQQAVDAYAKALSTTCDDVADYQRQAAGLQRSADTRSKQMAANDPQQDILFQHTSMQIGHLQQAAIEAKAGLARLGSKLAASIDMETNMAVPRSATLTPEQIRRRVDSSLGVVGLQGAAAHGTLSDAQAWAALTAAAEAVPDKAVNADGSVNWKEAVAEFNDKYLGPPGTAAAVAGAPPEGWALYRLLLNQREVAATANDLRTAFDEIVGPVALDLDRGVAGLSEINDALIRFKAVDDAFSALGPNSETATAVERAAAGGLPETGVIGALGKFAGGLAVVGDVFTIVDPGVKNKTEANVLRGTAALNIVGTGMAFSTTLLGVNAVADWVPGVGEVVMVGTGLILAGDYVYHHWSQITHGLSTAYHATTHALGTAYHATTHALSTAASATGHALSSAGHAIGHVFSSIF